MASADIEPKNPLPEWVLKSGVEIVAPSGLLNYIDFQIFAKIVDHFVDLEPKNWAILTAFYMGESDFTKVRIHVIALTNYLRLSRSPDSDCSSSDKLPLDEPRDCAGCLPYAAQGSYLKLPSMFGRYLRKDWILTKMLGHYV